MKSMLHPLMLPAFLFLTLSLFLFSGCAATGGPNESSGEDESRWKGLVEVVAAGKGGNSREKSLDALGEIEREWEKDRFFTKARVEWSESQKEDHSRERSRNRQALESQWDHNFSKIVYSFVRQDFERDEFQDLRIRSMTTAGLGVKILDETKHTLLAEGGLGYTKEEFYDDDNEEFMSALLKEKWEWRISEFWELVQTAELIPNLQEADDDFRTISTVDLRRNISENFYISAGVEHRYYAEPAKDKDSRRLNRQDWMVMLKLGYRF